MDEEGIAGMGGAEARVGTDAAAAAAMEEVEEEAEAAAACSAARRLESADMITI